MSSNFFNYATFCSSFALATVDVKADAAAATMASAAHRAQSRPRRRVQPPFRQAAAAAAPPAAAAAAAAALATLAASARMARFCPPTHKRRLKFAIRRRPEKWTAMRAPRSRVQPPLQPAAMQSSKTTAAAASLQHSLMFTSSSQRFPSLFSLL